MLDDLKAFWKKLPTWFHWLVYAIPILFLLYAIAACTPANAEAVPKNPKVALAFNAPGDSLTLRCYWSNTGPTSAYDGNRVTWTIAGRSIPVANLPAGAREHSIILTRTTGASESGQCAVAATRAGSPGTAATKTFTITWPAQPIPTPTVDSVIISMGPVQGNLDHLRSGGIAELPRAWVDLTMPNLDGRVLKVPMFALINQALDSARRGDIVELTAGATYTENVRLPAKAGTGWVVLRGPPAGMRERNFRANPRLVSYPKVLTDNSSPALAAGAFVQGYWIQGVELGATARNKGLVYQLVSLGPRVSTLGSLARDIVLDRVIVAGHDSLQTQRCVSMQGASMAVVDSWLAGCHAKGFDSQAIFGAYGPGPFAILNNRLEGCGENVMWGGSDPRIPGLVPSDIEIRQNHFVKPLAWHLPDGSSSCTVKNLYESKNSQRVLLEANVFENTWPDGQDAAWVFKSQNQDGNCLWCFTGDYTVRWNHVLSRDTAGIKAVVITGKQVIPSEGGESVASTRMDFTDNLFENVGMRQWTLQVGSRLTATRFQRNTFTTPKYVVFFVGGAGSTTAVDFADNLFLGPGGIGGDGMGGVTALTTYCPGCAFTGNAIVDGTASRYPTGNIMVPVGEAPPVGVGVDRVTLERKLQGVVQ